jgi:very-short-patch-repair endonuclease
MKDLTFLKALRDKLKGGNTRSIHLNVLPGRFASRLDFANLNYIEIDLAENFLKKLLTTACFEFKISFDSIDLNSISTEEQKKYGLLSKRLNSLYIENEDNYKEHGIKTFGFGYPIIIKVSKQDPTKLIKAPLFIWPLEIIKSFNKVNTWSILRNKIRNDNGKIVDDDVHSITLNEVLLSFIKSDESIIIPQLNEELLDDSIIDEKELIDECFKILKALNTNIDSNLKEALRSKLNEPIKNLPEAGSIESISGNSAWIHFGGVFGLFRTQKESIINDIDKIIERINEFDFDDLEVEKFSGTPHSAVETDPSQQEILNTLGVDPKKIIQGPPGTGKSQSLTALITNALANNLKCLVVCEKKTALDVIKNNLHRESDRLGALTAVIEDISKDRDGIVNSVRDRINELGHFAHFNSANYLSICEDIETSVSELNNQHQKLGKVIYKGKSWTELVGEFLKKGNTSDYTLLKTKLNYKEFKFSKDENELPEIISKLKNAKKLYSEINTLNHPLELLSDEIFKEDNPRGIQLKLEDLTKKITDVLSKLLLAFESEVAAYKIWLDSHYEQYYKSIKVKANEYFDFAEANNNKFGNSFFKNDGITKVTINVFSVFSERYKTLKKTRVELIEKTIEIKNIHLNLKYFEHSYIDNNNQSSLKVYVSNIKKLTEINEQWFQNIEKLKMDYLENISSDNLHPLYKERRERIIKLGQDYEQTHAVFNNEKILRRDILKSSTIGSKIEQGTVLLSETLIITENLEFFREYYGWRKFYIELSPTHRNIIKSVIETEHKDWIITFECWYYYWLLSLNEDKDLPKSDDAIQELYETKDQFRKIQINNIVSIWSKNQTNSTKKAQMLGINPTSLFNKRGSRGERRNSLRKIVKTDFNLFTDFFPVVMTSPSVCSSIIPLEEGLFDIVIFDEASQLRLEDTFPALIRGKIKIISGDSQQMPPSSYFQGGSSLLTPLDEDIEEEQINIEDNQRNKNNSLDLADSESLLVYAENSNYKQSYLKIHYRSQHPNLIDFSNHAFYGKRLIPMPPKYDYKPIHFIEVNGLYEDQGNRDEARQVVDILLNHIKPFRGSTFTNAKLPSVGVATFNLYQRNLILEELTKARQLSPEYDKRISDFGPDLFVKNLENIQGDERDVMIISTTFGKKSDGSFRQSFGPILQRNGYKLLNVIITRAKYKVYVCSSIPQEHIKQYSTLLQQSKNNGRAIFYAYLAYAKAISDGNDDIKQSILKQLYENCESKSFDIEKDVYGSESPFEEEVYYRLASRIGQNRIQQQYKIGGFRIDLIIKSEKTDRPVLAIECDGAKYHSSNEAYSWDMFRQKQIEQYGFRFYRIWSTNWFYSPEKELKKLVDFIQAFDREELSDEDISIEDFYIDKELIPITKKEEKKERIGLKSIVTVKNQEGKIIKIKFNKTQSQSINKADKDGVIAIYEDSALAKTLIGKTEGETCQLGMLEVYYEVLKIQ